MPASLAYGMGRFFPARLALALAGILAAPVLLAQEAEERPPFVATPPEVVERMLDLAGTTRADYVVDLGSGDGRIVIEAARRYGARGLGVDIDARLVAIARENARRAGVESLAAFEQRDALTTDLSAATVVTLYLLPGLVDRLQPKLLAELRPGARIVAHAFPMRGWRPDRRETLRLERRYDRQGSEATIYLWIVPAQVRGQWEGGEWAFSIQQNFQELEVEARAAGRSRAVTQARIEGARLQISGEGFAFDGVAEGGRLRGRLSADGGERALVLVRR